MNDDGRDHRSLEFARANSAARMSRTVRAEHASYFVLANRVATSGQFTMFQNAAM